MQRVIKPKYINPTANEREIIFQYLKANKEFDFLRFCRKYNVTLLGYEVIK